MSGEAVLGFLQRLGGGTTPHEALGTARGLTSDTVLARAYEMAKVFPCEAYPAEQGKLCLHRAQAYFQRGDATSGERYLRQAIPLVKRAGIHDLAARLSQLLNRGGDGMMQRQALKKPAYDHPYHWGAFQLVGRISP